MGIRTVTIPAAGTWEPFPIKGLSLYTWDMPVYSGPDQQPRLAFEDKSNPKWPLVLQSTYGAQEEFGQIWIQGTSESAGDTIEFLVYGDCRETRINEQGYNLYEAQAGTSFAKTTADTAASLSTLEITNSAGQLAKSIIVTAQNNPAIYAFNTAPDRSTDLGHILIPAVYTAGSEREVQLLEIEGPDFILNWQYASAISGSPAELTITPRY